MSRTSRSQLADPRSNSAAGDPRDGKYSPFLKALVEPELQTLSSLLRDQYVSEEPQSEPRFIPQPLPEALAWASRLLKCRIDEHSVLSSSERDALHGEYEKESVVVDRLQVTDAKLRADPEVHHVIELGFKAKKENMHLSARIAALKSMLAHEPKRAASEDTAAYVQGVFTAVQGCKRLIQWYEDRIVKQSTDQRPSDRPSFGDLYADLFRASKLLLAHRPEFMRDLDEVRQADQLAVGLMDDAKRLISQGRAKWASQGLDVNSGTPTEFQTSLGSLRFHLSEFRGRLALARKRVGIRPEENVDDGKRISGWKGICRALSQPLKKLRLIRKLAKSMGGPILFPGRGKPPEAWKKPLVRWWKSLPTLHPAPETVPSVSSTLEEKPYGRTGSVVPIHGVYDALAVKKPRSDFGKKRPK